MSREKRGISDLETAILSKDDFLKLVRETGRSDVDAVVIDVGKVNYPELFSTQRYIAEVKYEDDMIKDLILFAEHPPGIDFGHNPRKNSFLQPDLRNINPYDSEEIAREFLAGHSINFSVTQRSGGPAYLGPGQLNVYFVSRCSNAGITGAIDGQHKLDLIMRQIAETLGVRGVEVKDQYNDSDKRDVYISRGALRKTGELGAKIGSKVAMFHGIDFNKNVFYNGFSLFLNREGVIGFNFIPACGYDPKDLTVTSVQEILEERGIREGKIPLSEARRAALSAISDVFGYKKITRGVDMYA